MTEYSTCLMIIINDYDHSGSELVTTLGEEDSVDDQSGEGAFLPPLLSLAISFVVAETSADMLSSEPLAAAALHFTKAVVGGACVVRRKKHFCVNSLLFT